MIMCTLKYIVAVILLSVLLLQNSGSQDAWKWQGLDAFDEINHHMSGVNQYNCASMSKDELQLPASTLSQLPQFNQLLSKTFYSNRTNLLHLHNMALNRAFFYSYIFQKLNTSQDFMSQPGLMYYYYSAATDVSANENYINASCVYFDINSAYANFYTDLPFNTTLPLFAPCSWRAEDYNNPRNWQREPTNRTLDISDMGAGRESNYTLATHKTNLWYSYFLPDGPDKAGWDSIRKHPYDVGIKYSDVTGEFRNEEFEMMSFQGPPSPGQNDQGDIYLPVVFTPPYYDCARSNKWIVDAVAPVVDFIPRYLPFHHLRRFKFVASTALSIDFMAIDFNPCPLSRGNEAPNYFAGTSRCKDSTVCEPLAGWGFRRGGYECQCKPGYRYPLWQKGPFQGVDIEMATLQEYQENFDCIPVGQQQAIPVIRNTTFTFTSTSSREVMDAVFGERSLDNTDDATDENNAISDKVKRKLIPRYKRSVSPPHRGFDPDMYSKMQDIFQQKASVNRHNCMEKSTDMLRLEGDAAYGVDEQFATQALVAVRLSHFLSDFLQNIDKDEDYGTLEGDRLLNVEQLFGEVLANVMGDQKIKGSGIFFDEDAYVDNSGSRQLFGPYAYRHDEEDPDNTRANTQFRMIDYAGFPESYLNEPWFVAVKQRFKSNSYGIRPTSQRPKMRTDTRGSHIRKHHFSPVRHFSPSLEHGFWDGPYFDCDGYVNDWIVTYSVPFFGKGATGIEFKGVVIVDVRLDELQIQQCPSDFYVANAFKNTAKCHYESQYCLQIPSWIRYSPGAYKCECRPGYEYPYRDNARYYDGQTMEEQWHLHQQNSPTSRYHNLKCRSATGNMLKP